MLVDMMKNNNGDVVDNGNNNRLSRWHQNSSRIIRASKDSGGKDRHSKVLTSKGPRDRRVRLSVSTALQFYNLQDRLGYDQPSKAVEWLIKAADESISELPSLNTNLNQTLTGASAACSCNSDTSKNSSSVSLSKSEIRDEARERTKEKDHTSFTDLLNSGSDSVNQNRKLMTPPMEYFSSGLILGSGQTHFPIQSISHHFSSISDHQQEFSFVPNHLISPAGAFNLDFNISTPSVGSGGFSGLNRGTLQSNSTNQQSFLTNLQRFQSSESGGTQFLFGALPAENNHPHHNQNQLYSENGSRNSEQKGKAKN